ncbi:MAG: hypothetical protein ACKVXR_00845 [Planctomycetota bacterium]
MKNMIFALALVGLAFGCKSNSENTAVADPAAANMPKAECSMSKEACSSEAKAECAAKKSCCASKGEAPQN